jgi:hypothetical protein
VASLFNKAAMLSRQTSKWLQATKTPKMERSQSQVSCNLDARKLESSEIYRLSQEECARLREGVPCGQVYRYNPKHVCPKLNGYEDIGQRKVRSTCGSTHCTYQLTCLINVLSLSVVSCCLTLAVNCICASFRVRCGHVVNGLQWLNGYGDNGQRSLKLSQLLHTC